MYSYAKSAFDKRFVEGKGLSITEEKAIILETIFALQGRSADDDESQSKIWVFVFKHFCGYTLGQGTTEYQHYYRFFCKAIDKVMRLTNHFLVPTEKNRNTNTKDIMILYSSTLWSLPMQQTVFSQSFLTFM